MADQLILESPFGPLAFTPDQVREASARANEMVLAVGLSSDPTATPPPATDTATWLSVDELVQRTSLKKSWIYQEIRANRIPHRRFGRQVRIPASYLREPVPKSGGHQPGGQ